MTGVALGPNCGHDETPSGARDRQEMTDSDSEGVAKGFRQREAGGLRGLEIARCTADGMIRTFHEQPLSGP